MQGQRGTIGSLPEIEFDLGSSSNNAAMDQQICWNNLRNPPENHIPEYLLSQNDMDIAFVNSMSRERQTLTRWRSNEASSSNNMQGESGREKLELGWPSSGPRLEDQQREPINNAAIPDNSAVLMFSQSSNANPVQPNLNLGFVGHSGSNGQVTQFPSSLKFGGTESEQIRSSGGSERFLLPPGSAGFLVGGESDVRQSSMDRGQVSCKRKAIEGSIGPSSSNGSCSYFQRSNADSHPRPLIPNAQNGAGSGLSIFTPSSEQGIPMRLGLGFPDPTAMENLESSHRNLRRRTSLTSSSTQQISSNPSIMSAGRAARRSGLLSSQQPAMTLLPADQSLELRPISAIDNMQNPSQLHVIDAPPLQQQTVHPLRWSGASLARNGSSSSSLSFGDRDAAPPREDLSSRAMARTAVPDHHHHHHHNPIPVPDFRNLVRHQLNSRGLAGASMNIPANGASSTSRAAAPAALAPVWQQQPPPQQQQQNHQQQHPRRISEFLRRSLFPTVGSESGGGQGSNYAAALRAGQAGSAAAAAHEMGGGAGHHHHQPQPRLASWLERHNENNNGLGIHYSLRALGAGPEGSTRLVSEQIRNVLGIIRRGESLRFEDVMILDPAVFAGMAEMHDRHRDMRLDVDNMSYEELLALEERIGNVSTGLSEETVLKSLKHKKYVIVENLQSENEPCCVCQEDYNEGEDIGTLECGHDFHRDCIKQWLTQKNLCPICKTTALKRP